MARNTVTGERQTRVQHSGSDCRSLSITGWDVDPHEVVDVGLGTPGQSTANQSPRIQLRISCPEDAENPVDLGRPASVLRTNGQHVDYESPVLAVPETTGVERPVQSSTTGSDSASVTRPLHPGETIVQTYELVPAYPGTSRLRAGAYVFKTDISAERGSRGCTVWLSP